MITAAQQAHIDRHAYVPEQIPSYVVPISGTEPHLLGDYLVYTAAGRIILVGYPLCEPFETKRLERVLQDAVATFKPATVSLTAPAIPPPLGPGRAPDDHYYRLDLSTLSISQKLRNMLRRAGRELSVGVNPAFGREHREMVDLFLKTRSAGGDTRFIFERIDAYLDASETAVLFEARSTRRELVAFDIAEFRPQDYAVYMFNFRSSALYVPGASDLLLSAVVERAAAAGKKYINLGLGINPGVRFFKEKWGGVPFLPHALCLHRPAKKGFLEMLLRGL
ncbi:MAG: hypothetical protein AB1558_07225 [Thermodesulfobacteriota bacterium]